MKKGHLRKHTYSVYSIVNNTVFTVLQIQDFCMEVASVPIYLPQVA